MADRRVSARQIATYACIARETVSNWRRRHDDFPHPVETENTQQWFDTAEVAIWLDSRSLPRGHEHAGSARTYGELFRRNHEIAAAQASRVMPEVLLGRGLQLMLATANGAPSTVTFDDLDSQEVAAAIQPLISAAELPEAAERLYALASKNGWHGARRETSATVCTLITALVPELHAAWDALRVTELATTTGRLLAAIAEAGGRWLSYAFDDMDWIELSHLRLRCHRIEPQAPHEQSDVIVADPPFQSAEDASGPVHPLRWAEIALRQLTSDGYAFIVVPQWTLSRVGAFPVARTRDGLLRNGNLRAIIQLPSGTYPLRMGSDHALLILQQNIAGASVDVTFCDGEALRREFGEAWIGHAIELLAGPRSQRTQPPCVQISAESLRSGISLLPVHVLTPAADADHHLRHVHHARGVAIRAMETKHQELVDVLERSSFRPTSGEPRHTTIGELLRSGQLSYLRGHRLPPTAMGDVGQRIIGMEELQGRLQLGQRRVDLTNLSRYDATSLTEPGDVLLLGDRSFPAMVDEDGGSLLLYPAHGLRVARARRHVSTFLDEPQKPWIGPYALATLLRAARNSSRLGNSLVRRSGLQHMELPRIADSDRERLDELLYQLSEAAKHIHDQLTALEGLRASIGDGIADMVITLAEMPGYTTPRGR